jgi:hypothetical protein
LALPSTNACTPSKVSLPRLRTRARSRPNLVTVPRPSNSTSKISARRSPSGPSDTRPSDSARGNIGTTQPGQVVAGAAPQRLGVQRGAGPDVVRRVGDRVAQAEAAGAGLDEDRLIEIAGAGAVDGHERQPGAIDQLGIVEAGGGQVGGDLGLDRGGKAVVNPWAAISSENDIAAP